MMKPGQKLHTDYVSIVVENMTNESNVHSILSLILQSCHSLLFLKKLQGFLHKFTKNEKSVWTEFKSEHFVAVHYDGIEKITVYDSIKGAKFYMEDRHLQADIQVWFFFSL